MRRSAAALAALLVAGAFSAFAAPAQAATIPITIDVGELVGYQARYSPQEPRLVGTSTTSLRVTFPSAIAALDIDEVTWTYSRHGHGTFGSGVLSWPLSTFDLAVDGAAITALGGAGHNLTFQSSGASADYLLLSVFIQGNGVGQSMGTANLNTIVPSELRQSYGVDPDYSDLGIAVNWGDAIALRGPAGFWIGRDVGGQVPWNTSAESGLISADDAYASPAPLPATFSSDNSTMTVTLPSAPPATADWGLGTLLLAEQYSSAQATQKYRTVGLPLSFDLTDRYAGPDRFATSALIAQQFATASRVYVANGRNYPDALSAAPAAAHAGGPLLLVDPNVLPDVIKTELLRLNPTEVVVAGGLNQVSQSVRDQIVALLPGVTLIEKAGSNRYETSRLITEFEFGTGATDAYVVTGRNFPDALAASAAAAHFGGPVILIDGSASSIDDATQATLDGLGVTTVRIAGSNAVVTDAIQSDLIATYGAGNVIRNSGVNRYETSIAINNDAFSAAGASEVYLALGTGYADALSGAALAGAADAPLFTVPGSCVPQGVLDAILSYGATSVVLLGSSNGLSDAVGSLAPC